MGRKANEQTYPCNLLELREELQLTQKQLVEILDVSERMIGNYETGVVTLPIYKAILLCQKYNYTLDWIYCHPANTKSASTFFCESKAYPKFVVDIRDFLSYANDTIFFTIPNYYWKYMKERSAIASSKSTVGEKKRKIAELDGKYEMQESEQKYWINSMTAEEFLSHLRLASEFIPFADNSDSSIKKPSKEHLKEARAFLESVTDTNDAL